MIDKRFGAILIVLGVMAFISLVVGHHIDLKRVKRDSFAAGWNVGVFDGMECVYKVQEGMDKEEAVDELIEEGERKRTEHVENGEGGLEWTIN